MNYPDYPNNRLIVDGIDLTEKYGMILMDGYVLNPPQPKTYSIDIPCGDGKLDLTETLRGRAVYQNRSMEFTFCIINVENVELTKSTIAMFLHGKAYNFEMTMDPNYIYHGRFTISSFEYGVYNVGKVLVTKIMADVDPYKHRSQAYSVSAVGGTMCQFLGSTQIIKPTINSGGNLKIVFNNQTIYVNSSSWSSDDVRFDDGTNDIYFNSYETHYLKWSDLETVTWSNFKTKRLFEWYKSVGTIDQTLAREVNVSYDWRGI